MRLSITDAVAGYDTPVSPAVTLTVDAGDVVGLAGPNGIGKSTVLKAVLGAARLFSGHIEHVPGLRIGYLPQHPVRLPEVPLSGSELLAALKVDAVDPPAGLADKLATRIDRLSGGEYQLLMLWATLAAPDELILLDEPTNNLDGRHVGLAVDWLSASRLRRATLVVSHDRGFLDAVCTRIVELEAAGG